ncbi:hypothetical protein ACIQ7D_18060 [Streptomyces sp. NPDC096310]|uniref:hypothetical protein n=1 Tax=Streptomyces sp. NPDC096310 TaxID=3366082 RepID=UPI0038068DFA
MTTIEQPALDGTVPAAPVTAARRRVDDYETWVAEVWPTFEEVAASGRPFTSWEIADEYQLPEPPNSKSHWGNLVSRLRDANLIAQYGWANSLRPGDNDSGVKVWRGTRSARTRRAA